MKPLSRSQNKLISFISIAIFAVGILLVAFFSVTVYRNYQENLILIEEQKALDKEKEYQEKLEDSTSEDGTYVVYTSDEEVIYGEDIIIIG